MSRGVLSISRHYAMVVSPSSGPDKGDHLTSTDVLVKVKYVNEFRIRQKRNNLYVRGPHPSRTTRTQEKALLIAERHREKPVQDTRGEGLRAIR